VNNFSEKVNFIWSIAELLRDSFKRSKYPDVVLPFTVLRRIDCVLEPTKEKVLALNAKLKARGLENRDPQLRRASGVAFYNTSRRLAPHPGRARSTTAPGSMTHCGLAVGPRSTAVLCPGYPARSRFPDDHHRSHVSHPDSNG